MSKTIIIAEAGVNHNGDMALAKQLINVAAEAGADYVKFQTFKADKLVSKSAKQAEYQVKNQAGQSDDSQYGMLKRLELSEQHHYELQEYANQKGIKFLSTGFEHDSINFLDELGLDFFKIPSGEITNKPYLKHVAGKGKPVVLSTGMASLKEIDEALEVLEEAGLQREDITVLHCNTEYPTPIEDVNLKAMLTIRDAFKINVGYSDHTMGIEVPVAAVALGATIIEKHFTLDKNLPGPDHKASLEPAELKAMVQSIRNIELALSGDGRKKPSPSEKKNKPMVRKSLFYSGAIPAGTVLEESHFIAKRPATGISPMRIDDLLGKTLKKEVNEGDPVEHNDFS
ncbi:N-acetylneuraminate synthase [Pontibacter diazotrophicus]|uniref:N-acetylneuraminate synthase n=1 Tax=Pontibacter diazotrophicus TaxID=1400979 RepID=A0A3D8LF96_9BACT|nr:N-acetylneuraminate synthase [Pontibacter diazotrophicus]RDV16121.1 N-acetylneuraminate synthase [Pontibacter diazotrophicus]